MRYIMAAVMGLFSGFMIMIMSSDPAVASSTAIIVASIFFCEATILHKLEGQVVKKE